MSRSYLWCQVFEKVENHVLVQEFPFLIQDRQYVLSEIGTLGAEEIDELLFGLMTRVG